MPSADPLPSWRSGATREAIEGFVAAVGQTGGPGYLPPAERVAVFDNDGTLWCEKPTPIQIDFILRHLAQAAEREPALRDRQPWKAAYTKDPQWLSDLVVKHYHGDDTDLKVLIGALTRSFGGMRVDAYEAEVSAFLADARHPTLDRPYARCLYQPMVELLHYLESHQFTCYIASGGDRDFMRPAALPLYGVPPERVIGSTFGLQYAEDDHGGAVLYKAELDFFDDGPQKPIRIWSRVGRRPILACGNANGDVPMLRFAAGGDRTGLGLLINHDDADREFAYTAGAEDALKHAEQERWTTVSIRDDWATVFPEPAHG